MKPIYSLHKKLDFKILHRKNYLKIGVVGVRFMFRKVFNQRWFMKKTTKTPKTDKK